MKFKLPSLTLLVLVGAIVTVLLVLMQGRGGHKAAGTMSSSPDPSTPAEGKDVAELGELVQRAVLALQSRYSVSAKVRQNAELFGRQIISSGFYLERRSELGAMFRFEMRVQLHEHVNSMLDICDGRYLWQYRKLRNGDTLSRVDLARVNRALEEAGRTFQPREIGESLSSGGVARLLGGLSSAFDFVSIERVRLWEQVSTWRLEGRWKLEQLVKLLPNQEKDIRAGKPANLEKLPEQLPDRVVLFLGTEDLFPYRIEYHRQTPEDFREGTPGKDRLVSGIDFFEVSLNVPVDPVRFMYSPGNVQWIDETDKVLQRLGLQ
jgi:hypothetical protein